jgi:hypothetical protein
LKKEYIFYGFCSAHDIASKKHHGGPKGKNRDYKHTGAFFFVQFLFSSPRITAFFLTAAAAGGMELICP